MNDSIPNKTCAKCHVPKPLDEFYIQSGRATTMAYCKECLNEQTMNRIRENRQRAIALKGGCCERCGFNECEAALDFHHRDPSIKEKGVSKLFSRSWKRVLTEVEKCDLLCGNCHAKHHCTCCSIR